MSRAALELFDKHEASLRAAGLACRERSYFTLFPETPDRHRGGAAAAEAGIAAFRAQLGRAFELDQPGTLDRIGGEVSPYTLEPLGIDYPRADIDALFAAARSAMPALGGREAAGAPRRLHGDRRSVVRERVRDGASRDAHGRPERSHELRGERNECAGSRRRGTGVCAGCDVGCARRGAVGAAVRIDDDPAAQALSAGPARCRRVLCLRHVPDLECVPGDACEPRDG